MPEQPQPPPSAFLHGFLVPVLMVLAAAAATATLFTAWTPGETVMFGPVPEGMAFGTGAPRPSPTAGFTPTPRLRPLIGLVAGHWGNDSGAVCSDGLTEKDVNLNIATIVQRSLLEMGFDVDLLQEFDPKLTGYQATALVSIHADSCEFVNNEATGFKVASAMANLQPEKSAYLTACLRGRYGEATGLPLHSTSVTLDMTSYHAFGEIDPSTPAAIIEVGFLNLDRQLLTQQPQLVAEGIVRGIICFVKSEDPSPATATPYPQPQSFPTIPPIPATLLPTP